MNGDQTTPAGAVSGRSSRDASSAASTLSPLASRSACPPRRSPKIACSVFKLSASPNTHSGGPTFQHNRDRQCKVQRHRSVRSDDITEMLRTPGDILHIAIPRAEGTAKRGEPKWYRGSCQFACTNSQNIGSRLRSTTSGFPLKPNSSQHVRRIPNLGTASRPSEEEVRPTNIRNCSNSMSRAWSEI